jgi:hypothetical protein
MSSSDETTYDLAVGPKSRRALVRRPTTEWELPVDELWLCALAEIYKDTKVKNDES